MSLLCDYSFQTVAAGSALLGIISGALGSFCVLRKQSLLGDGLSHAALPGVIAVFLLTGSRATEALLLGAALSGLLATAVILIIEKHSKIHFDSALALVMSVFFGLGILLMTQSQKHSNARQAGLERFIYGQAASLLKRDVVIMAICCGAIIITLLLFWKEFKLLAFDPIYAHSLGLGTGKLNLLLSLMTVTAIVLGLQTVGVVLMSAMLIAPAIAARQWTDSLGITLLLSAIFGAAAGVSGTFVSSALPGMPTGPVTVVCITAISVFSLLFAPKRGLCSSLIFRKLRRIS